MAIYEPPDYRKLYDEQCKQTESWRQAAEVLRETLRDQFAMAALNGVVCCTDPSQEEAAQLAASAYLLADAMLAARIAAEAVRPLKLSGCPQENGSGWCLNPDIDGACKDQVPTDGGNTACGRAL